MYINYIYPAIMVAMVLVMMTGMRKVGTQRQKQIDLLERIATALEQRKP
jgi:hypothetical protein